MLGTELPESLSIWVVLIVCAAIFVRGAFGFGDGLLAVPLLSWLMPVVEAVALILLLSVLTSITGLYKERSNIQLNSLRRSGISALLAFPIGVALVGIVDDKWVRFVLGSLLVGLAAWSTVRPRGIRINAAGWSYGFGFVAGLFGGAYALRGVVFAIYGDLRGWTPAQLRATLHSFYLVTSLLIPFTFAATGLFRAELLMTVLLLALPAASAGSLGQWAGARLSPVLFRRGLWLIVGGMGVLLLLQASLL